MAENCNHNCKQLEHLTKSVKHADISFKQMDMKLLCLTDQGAYSSLHVQSVTESWNFSRMLTTAGLMFSCQKTEALSN
jgi:hypothetical protein